MNVYDKEVKIYTLDAGTPLQARLRFVSRHLGREESVYAARFWDSVQAGTQIDKMIVVPFGRMIETGMFAAVSGGTPMRIEQAQYEYDADGNPVTRLSLRRMDERFEIAVPEVKP